MTNRYPISSVIKSNVLKLLKHTKGTQIGLSKICLEAKLPENEAKEDNLCDG